MNHNKPLWINEVKNSAYDLSRLPENIEQEIADYLDVEHLQSKSFDPLSLKYVGQSELWEKPIMCWDFGDGKMYVTVQPYGESYLISLTEKQQVRI